MKGDFTRSTFKKEKHYHDVRMQQGRVQLDSDWNEQQDITYNRVETESADLIGISGTPYDNAGFNIEPDGTSASLLISKGDYYIDGILCQNEQDNIPIDKQPDFKTELPNVSGYYLAYLDVWQRHITALDDPDIREVALGGPDTATRSKTIWQVKLFPLKNEYTCLDSITEWDDEIAPGTGTLAAQVEKDASPAGPCDLGSSGGYRGLENRLYRVEVHKGGIRKDASFKWSRDNGSVVAKWEDQDPKTNLKISKLGRDYILKFSPGQWVELTDDLHELAGEPGILVKLADVQGDVLIISDADASGIEFNDFSPIQKIRRWDSDGEIKVTNKNPVDLEDGVQVIFNSGTYKTGDYWMIPARIEIPGIEWPQNGNDPEFLPPDGIQHHYSRLAVLQFNGTKWDKKSDCRSIFPPVTKLINILYVGGDGQEAMPGRPLVSPLQVRVVNGGIPVKDAKVQYSIEAGGGTLTISSPILSDALGIATNNWTLGNVGQQRVKAALMDAAGTVSGQVVNFNADLSTADNVKFTPKDGCQLFKDKNTVQSALDGLCTNLINLLYVGGDGQEAMPGHPLDNSLQLRIVIGGLPYAGAKVKFTIEYGVDGILSVPNPAASDSSGFVTIDWTLGRSGRQRVKAELLDATGPVPGQVVYFNADLSIAKDIAFDPGNCPNWSDQSKINTVEDALNDLCRQRPKGGCCTTVVNSQDNLIEIIESIIDPKKDINNICVCMTPGDYFLDKSLILKIPDGKNINLTIMGCSPGTNIFLKESNVLIFSGFSFIIIRDLQIRITGTPGEYPIRFENCKNVEISSCNITSYEISKDNCLLNIGATNKIQLENNMVEAYVNKDPEVLRRILEKTYAPISNLFSTIDNQEVEANTGPFLDGFSKLDQNTRLQLAENIKKEIEIAQGNSILGIEEKTMSDDLINAISNKKVNKATLKGKIKRILSANVIRYVPSNALIIMDGKPDTMIAKNKIIGIISLYGPHNIDEKPDDNYSILAENLHKLISLLSFTNTGKILYLCKNQLLRVVISTEMISNLNKLTTKNKIIPGDLFSRCFITENAFIGENNLFLSNNIYLTSNSFSKLNIGAAMAESIIFNGNHSENIKSILYNISKYSSKAANLFITIQPDINN